MKNLWNQLERKIPHFFSDIPKIIPSLLHGDLWSGNFAETATETGKDMLSAVQVCKENFMFFAVIFDPASFFGHSEYDFGIARMFGGFDKSFYDAYFSIVRKSEKFEKRNQLYQLFHYLNHW